MGPTRTIRSRRSGPRRGFQASISARRRPISSASSGANESSLAGSPFTKDTFILRTRRNGLLFAQFEFPAHEDDRLGHSRSHGTGGNAEDVGHLLAGES